MKPKETNTYRENSSKKYQSPRKVKSEHGEFLAKVGTKLQEIRKEKKISISFLSRDLGISRNAYSQMERGTVYFSLSNLMKILDYFGKDAEHFFRTLSKH
jgi:predicted transcriptional regulator